MNEEMKAKLPKWALYEVVKMERELEALREQVAANDNPNSTITYGYPIKHGLPDRTTVCFLINGSRFDVDIRNDELQIYSSDTIAVMPRASNAVTIRSMENR